MVCLLTVVCLPTPAWADSVRDGSWQLTSLRVPAAQQISTGAGVRVAVVDSGVNAQQPELAGAVLPGTDATAGFSGDGHTDKMGHGTRMATLIAGHGRGPAGRDGVLGIAPGAKILPVIAVGPDGTKLAGAISWAVAHGARVLCLAISGDDSPSLDDALDQAFAADVVVVAATGNRPATQIRYPAAYTGVVAVSGTDEHGQSAAISVTGPEAMLSAPATNVPAPGPDGRYGISDGTSVSTALVAGAAALVRAKYPQMSAKEVIHRLEVTADDKGAPGRDDEYGYGIVDPVKALTAEVPPLSPSPSATTAGPTGTAHAGPAGHDNNHTPLILAGVVVLLLLAAGGVVAVKIRR